MQSKHCSQKLKIVSGSKVMCLKQNLVGLENLWSSSETIWRGSSVGNATREAKGSSSSEIALGTHCCCNFFSFAIKEVYRGIDKSHKKVWKKVFHFSWLLKHFKDEKLITEYGLKGIFAKKASFSFKFLNLDFRAYLRKV